MALALHANFDGNVLYLWAENTAAAAKATANAQSVAPSDAARAAEASPPVHPHAADLDVLRAIVGELSEDSLLASVAVDGRLALWLPATADGTPLPSPAASSTAQAPPDASLRKFIVPALVFTPDQAVDLLTSLPVADAHGDAIDGGAQRCIRGESLRYWAIFARFCLDLISRRQFVPQLERVAIDAEAEPVVAGGEGEEPEKPDWVLERYLASWRPVVQNRDELEWLERFAVAMPPSCVAQDDPPIFREGGPADAAQLVDRFLGCAADAVIRRAVADDPFFRTAAERAREPLAAAETRWLAALLEKRHVVSGRSGENSALLQMVQGWVGQLEPSQATSNLKLTFCLEEPEEDEDAVAPGTEILVGNGADAEVSGDSAGQNGAAVSPREGQATGQTQREEGNGAGATSSEWSAGDNGTAEQLDGDNVGTESAADASSAEAFARGSQAPAELVASETNGAAPAPADDRWVLRLALHPPEDDGEIVDAAELWSDDGPMILGRSIKSRRQRLMSELTRAAEIFPPAVTLLSQPAPARTTLTTAEAYAFIRQWAPQLREGGFGVVLPMWAHRGAGELGLRLRVSPVGPGPAQWDDADDADTAGGKHPMKAGVEFSSGRFGLDSLLEFDWQIAMGDLQLTASEFSALAAAQSPLVRVRGQWIQVDAAAAKQAADFLQRQQGRKMTLAEALRNAYGATTAETGLPVLGLTGSSWIEQLLEQAPLAKMEVLEQPKAFAGTLRPYQLRGLQWLAFLDRVGIGGCLADDMGLGKTIQLIALLLYERSPEGGDDGSKEPKGPTLLFAPTSVVGNWVREIQRFGKQLTVLIHHGPERLSGDAFVTEAAKADVVITSYALAHRDHDELKRIAWRRIALDEAQKIKNPSAASTIAIRSLVASRRLALTGTPIENHLSELWSIMEILNPGLLGPAADFRERFAVPIEKLGEKERAEQLRRLIRPFILRRLKTDPEIAGDLPEKMEMRVFCNLTSEQAAHYERIVGDSLNQIDAATGIRRRGLILSVLTRLKQICDHPSLVLKDSGPYDQRSGKGERLIEMLEELLDAGDAALVFTQFREMGHVLEKMIKERLRVPVQFLHGGTPAKERDAMIDRFQAGENGLRIFLLSLRAGGLGLNLTAANHVFHFDRWWNPAVESQATDRAHRVGQTRKVQVHKFVCIGTMEERIDRLLSEKLALADRIIGSGDEWLTSMSTEQLRQYLTLNREAIGEF